MSARLRTVVVGFGGIAQGLGRDARMARYFRYATHAQVLDAHPAFDWRAVVDPDPGARAAAASWKGRAAVATLADLPRGEAYDVAVLAGPPATRLAAITALPGLRAVLAEKPLGGNQADTVAVVDLCRSRGIALQVNLWRRGDSAMRGLAAGGRSERIGRVQAGCALYGNGLRNNGTHLVDLLRMLCGEVAAVRALGPATALAGAPLAGDVAIAGDLELAAGGRIALQPVDFAHYREVGLDLWGERGRLSILHEGLLIEHFARADNRAVENAREISCDRPQVLPVGAADALWHLYDNMAGHLANSAPLLSPGSNALATDAVIAALLDSARREGRPVAPAIRQAA